VSIQRLQSNLQRGLKEIMFHLPGRDPRVWRNLERKLVQVNYLQTKPINVYIKQEDLKRVTYICTESKHKREGVRNTVISSQICSKVK
jgi:hypothetical protein